jgi:ABC-type antimicrobial peptide transport system permease subunit
LHVSSTKSTKKKKIDTNSFIIAILFFISAATIVNTMLMAVMERFRELGMLMSLGMKGREVMLMVLLEAVSIGVAGGAAGAIIGGIVSYALSRTGIPLGHAMDNVAFPIGDTLRVTFLWYAPLVAFLFGLIMTILSALWPAAKASRLSPTEALRTI